MIESLRDRIWRLSHSKICYGIVITLTIALSALGFFFSIKAWIIKMYMLPKQYTVLD